MSGRIKIGFEQMYNWHYCVVKYDNGDGIEKIDYIKQERFKELINFSKIKLIDIFRINLNEKNAKKLSLIIKNGNN